MRGGGGDDQFAHDAAEKPPRYNSNSASTAPRNSAFASSAPSPAPPVAQSIHDSRYTGAPMRFAASPPPRQAPYPSFYDPQQQHQQREPRGYQQQQQHSSGGDRFPASNDHGPSSHPQMQQQQSFQYYAPGQFAPHREQQQQQQYHQEQPLLPQYAPQAAGCRLYPPLPVDAQSFRRVSCPPRIKKRHALLQLLRLIGFHILNAVLGFAAFSLLGSGVSSSVSLLPLCCFGIIVFRVVLYGVHVVAGLDVLLVNYIASPLDRVYLDVPVTPNVAGLVLAPSLAAFSPLSLMALLYYMSIKFGVAVLSAASAVLSVAPFALLVFVLCGGQHVKITVGDMRIAYEDDHVAFIVAAVCCTVIGWAAMMLVAKLSIATTKFFCCESFSTYAGPMAPAIGYQNQQQQGYANRAMVSYGTA